MARKPNKAEDNWESISPDRPTEEIVDFLMGADKPKRTRRKPSPETGTPQRITEARPTGRPSLFTPEIAEEICDRIACGETLPNICRDEHMPAEKTIRKWARHDAHGFREAYARAREEQMHAWSDEIITISDDGSRDVIVTEENGRKVEKVNHDHIQRSKLRVDTRKFLMAKIAPKTFGEKVDIDLRTGPLDEMNDEQLAEHILRLASGLGVSIAGFGEGDGGEAPAPEPKPARLI